MIHDIDALFEGNGLRFDKVCHLGSSSKSSSTQNQQQAQTSSNAIDPTQLGQFNANLAHAQGAANSLTPYSGQMVAGFSPNQTQAQGIFSGIGTNPASQQALSGATGSVQGILGSPINGQINPSSISPSMVSPSQIAGANQITASPVSANPITAGLLKNTDLSPYMNPYTKDVINTSIDQNERARQMAQVSDAQQATAAGAFGGSRSGVAASLTNGEYDRNSQANIANLNAANFGQAQSAATGDINRTLGADQFNAGQNLSAQQFNSGQNYNAQQQNAANTLGMQQFNAGQDYASQIANQNAGMTAGQFNANAAMSSQNQTVSNQLAAAGLTLNAAGEIIPLSQASLADASSRAGILDTVGGQQQQQQQNELSAAYQAYTQGQQLTLAQQQMLNQALGMIPIQQSTNSSGNSSGSSTSQTQTNPGLGGILGGIGSLGMGLGALSSSGAFGAGGLGGLFGLGAPSSIDGYNFSNGAFTNGAGPSTVFGAAGGTMPEIPYPTFNAPSVSMPRLS